MSAWPLIFLCGLLVASIFVVLYVGRRASRVQHTTLASQTKTSPTLESHFPHNFKLVYFIWTGPHRHGNLVRKQLAQIWQCPLIIDSVYPRPLHVVISGGEEERLEMKALVEKLVSPILGSLVCHGTDQARWEHWGIYRVWQLANQESDNTVVLGYMHSKGMQSAKGVFTQQSRRLFDYTFTPEALHMLRPGTGVRKAALFGGRYDGETSWGWVNFWMATAESLKANEEPINSYDNRYPYETWLGSSTKSSLISDNSAIFSTASHNNRIYTKKEIHRVMRRSGIIDGTRADAFVLDFVDTK